MVTYHPNATDPENLGEPLTVDFTPPFRRVRMIPDLEKVMNVKLPPPSEFETPGNDGVKVHYFYLGRGCSFAAMTFCVLVKKPTPINYTCKPELSWDS